jgi:hypothetical protein
LQLGTEQDVARLDSELTESAPLLEVVVEELRNERFALDESKERELVVGEGKPFDASMDLRGIVKKAEVATAYDSDADTIESNPTMPGELLV